MIKSLAWQRLWNRFWQTKQSVGIKGICSTAWAFFWMRCARWGYSERFATWIATWFAPPYKKRRPLAKYNARGYIAPSANLDRSSLQRGANVFLGERVSISQEPTGGSIKLGDRVHLHNDTVLHTKDGGKLVIGKDTHIQPGCQLVASQGTINIGSRVQIAPNCSLNSHPDHQQSYQLKSLAISDINIKDDVWIGHGVTVLAGVTIGAGAVIGSGSVVTQDIPAGAIAIGMPARSVKMRTSSHI